MDYDDRVFKEVEVDNVTISPVELPSIPNQYVAEEVTLIVFGIVGIAMNILLIYIICYFRKLHTNINIYLINWAIADIGSVLITISCFRVVSNSLFEVPDEVLCLYFGLGGALLFNVILFMIILTMDWCLASYLPRPLGKFRQHTKAVVAVVWILAVFYSVASSALCSLSLYYLVFHFTLPVAFAILLFFVVVLHLLRIYHKLKGHFEYHSVSMLILPSAFVLCWLLSWANLLFFELASDFYMVTETPLFLHPTINFVLLVLVDKDFKTCFFQLTRCSVCGPNKSSPENWTQGDSSAQDPAPSLNRGFDYGRHM